MQRLSFQFNNLLGTVYRQGNLVFSNDGSILYAAVGNRVSGFDLVRSKSFTFPFEARRNIARLALSPDGAILLAVDDEGHLLMANTLRRVVVHHLNLKKRVSDVKFSPDGKWVAFALGRLVQVWATPTLERSFTPFSLFKTLGGHGDDIICLAWSADSLFIASGGKDLSVRVHSVHRLPGYAPPSLTGHRSSVRGVFFSDDGQTIYAVTRDAALSVWERTDRPDAEAGEVAKARKQAIEEGGPGRGEEAIGQWWTLTARHYFDKNHARVSSAVLHSGTNMLIIGFVTGVFALYELPSGGTSDTKGLTGALSNGTSDPLLAAAADNGGLVEVHTLSISEARVDACAVSPSGEWLAFGCAALGQLLVWEWRSESYVLKQQGHFAAEVHALAYSPAGSVIATAGGDNKVKLWSPTTGFCFVTFTGMLDHSHRTAAPLHTSFRTRGFSLPAIPHKRGIVGPQLQPPEQASL